MGKPRQAIALFVSALLALAAGYFAYSVSKGDRPTPADFERPSSEALFATKFSEHFFTQVNKLSYVQKEKNSE